MSSSLGFLKSIIIYQASLEGNMDKTEELLEAINQKLFNSTYYDNIQLFFDYVLRDVSCKDTLKENIILYLKKIQNISSTIDSYFFTKPDNFLETEMKSFFILSSTLETSISNIIEKINIQNISINKTENTYVLSLQKEYRNYIKVIFMKKFMESALRETGFPTSTPRMSGMNYKRDFIKWNVEIIRNHVKKAHYEHVFHQVYTPVMDPKKKTLATLYFLKNVNYLEKIDEDYSYTHNMTVREYNPKNEYALQKKDNLYNIRYDINNVKENEVRRIYIYGYTTSNGKKVFIGFAYYTTEHFRETSRKFLSRFFVW
jgi:hypothetical protein